MKSFAKYISKYLMTFLALVFLLAVLNIIVFAAVFYGTVKTDYGQTSPRSLLANMAACSSASGISDEAQNTLQENNVWAMFLSSDGNCVWSVDLPQELPAKYQVQDVAAFSRGYLQDYPVFVWDMDDGLLVLGYPKGSYTKITGNYYSTDMLRIMPAFLIGILALDLIFLFGAYYLSKMKLVKDTAPLVSSIKTLADGKPVSLQTSGELSEVAGSLNKASEILSRQNTARANWISGVSHDIRTPLSMIMGYAQQITDNSSTDKLIRDQAEIIQKQSQKIKNLVDDLNLVSKLEYDVQPLHRENIRLSKLLRSFGAELLNGGLPESYSVDFHFGAETENITMNCDARLISRVLHNLVQNSIRHNPKGCHILLSLDCTDAMICFSVSDDGIGLTPEKLKELNENTHYMNSTDDRLNLRHGLGIVLVRQIAEVHGGTMQIESVTQQGFRTTLCFPKQPLSTTPSDCP